MNTVFEILNKVYGDAEKTAKTLFEKGLTDKDVEFVFKIEDSKIFVIFRAISEKGYVVLKELDENEK